MRASRPASRAIVLAVTAVAACGRPPPWRAPDPREEGRTWYVRACASCHGETGRGDGPVTAELTVRPPDLTTLAARSDGRFPRAYFIAVVTGDRGMPAHGTREMPVWSEQFGTGSGAAVASLFARRRLEALADYVASLQRPGP